ncbi:MAG: T9SS type A sorting domain-containing protein [Saprospiraceae bacterium]
MKLFTSSIWLTATFIFTQSILFAQMRDTVDVPTTINGSPFGAINKFIIGDTTSTGERNNPNRVYRLKSNSIYFLDGIFFADFDLNLIGETPEDGKKPPIIASTAGSDGTIQLIQFKFFENATIKNVICQMTPPSGNGESNAAFFLSGQKKNYEFDNVRIEWGLWTGITTEVPVNKVVIKNCYFRNLEHKTDIWNGRGMNTYQQNPADTVIMQNNTFFNLNSFVFAADVSTIPPKYLYFDHNTIVNTMKFPIHSFWLPNATVTNNIFFNAHSYGENSSDIVGQDPQKLLYGIINIDKIPNALKTYYQIKEEDRKYLVANNVFYYEPEVKAYWNSFSLPENPFMNSRNVSMFGDDATYPYLTVQNTIEENPMFVEPGAGRNAMITWMSNRRNLQDNNYWGWDPDQNKFEVQWPFPEDLSFTNEKIKTAANGGFPVGDLNWWKAEKELWEAWKLTGSSDFAQNLISDLRITPNPSTDKLQIQFYLESNSDIDIEFYKTDLSSLSNYSSMSGKQGLNLVDINLSDVGITQNGVYFLVIKSGNYMVTKKIVKI